MRRGSWAGRRAVSARHFDDQGFTLVELMISVIILTIVMGAIAFSLLAVFSLTGGASRSTSDSADAQVVSSTLTNDVQSALQLTTLATAQPTDREQCGPATGTQLLGLEWGRIADTPTKVDTPKNFTTVVSYLAVQRGKTWTLVRDLCLAGFSSTPSSIVTVSSDICEPTASDLVPVGCKAPQSHPTVYPTTPTKSWLPSTGVTKVSFGVTEPGSDYSYTLVSSPVPGRRGSTGPSGVVSSPYLSCDFAAPTTGPYSRTLCFASFQKYCPSPHTQTVCGYTYEKAAYTKSTCGDKVTEGIAGTPFTLSFCLKVQAGTETSPKGEAPPSSGSWHSICESGTPAGTGSGVPPPPNPPPSKAQGLCTGVSSADLVAAALPTYTDAPASEAYLGNNGFYTGVTGDSALYTYIEGSSATLYFTTITVKDQNGNTASSWQLVTGDAESTDATESITWSTCPSPSGGLQTSCTGSPPLSLIPDYPSTTVTPPDYYGNACMNTKYTNAANSWLRYGSLVAGMGTVFEPSSQSQEVECAAGRTVDKTGTVMLEAPEPKSLTVNLVGQGLQAVFLGFRL